MKMLRRACYPVAVLALSLAALAAIPTTSFAAQPTVGLGTASSFAVLAGQTVTNTGVTTIGGSAGGDIGVFPGSAFTGQDTVVQSNGAVYLADEGGVALQAQSDLTTAYDDAAGRTPATTIPTELGETTLTPGVYTSESGTFEITGTLTLDAEGDPDAVFIFQTSSTLVTASDSSVNLINSARACKVFWQVGSSATLGTGSYLVGHVLALTSITANTGAEVYGQLLARNGSVTLDTNTITNDVCAAIASPIISVAKSPDPSSLTGSGDVTYTYTVTNPGVLALNDVTVTDDQIGSLTYVSGDDNADGILQPGETWVYTATAHLDATTTNTVTATGTGSVSGETATDTASTTVVVNSLPAISVTKSADPSSLTGSGDVTYTYTVTNPGTVALSGVSVTDDQLGLLTYVSGDDNGDGLLQPGETWVYTATAHLDATTTNTVTVTGSGNGVTATDTASVTVVVSSGSGSGTATLPKTGDSTGALALGLLLAACAGVGMILFSRRGRKD